VPRPRTISDEALLDRALAILAERGPASLTFAALAERTGLATATLVQRFGSKPALVRAALLRAWDLLEALTAAADRAAPSSPAGAVALLLELSEIYTASRSHDEGLVVLREDFRDPVARARGERWGNVLAEALGRRLSDATGPREDLGRLMAAQWQGTVLLWGFAPSRPLRDVVEEALRDWCAAIGRPLSGETNRSSRVRKPETS
jgi:AcrR family transcriptional regulator